MERGERGRGGSQAADAGKPGRAPRQSWDPPTPAAMSSKWLVEPDQEDYLAARLKGLTEPG